MEALLTRVHPPDWTVTSSFLHTIAAIMDPSRIVFKWIPRSDNVLAHELARKALFRNVETLKESEVGLMLTEYSCKSSPAGLIGSFCV
ncbi:hypothetical protein L484_021587 [Morus notabilis]|uniref:Uncharacterized protein n=1 Tax=Morus notabilis TaxID=981085 RepID=W9RXW3_9ROSA|nr:hypothetical protein L484_021587 [Morus notabilis]